MQKSYQANAKQIDKVNKHIKPKKGRSHNKVLPKAGRNGFDWTFVQGSTFVLRLSFCAENPRLRQYQNRYTQSSLNNSRAEQNPDLNK